MSEHVLWSCRRISGFRQVLAERPQSREDLGQRTSAGDRLDDQTFVFLLQNDLVTRELQLAWNPQGLLRPLRNNLARCGPCGWRLGMIPSLYQRTAPWRPERPALRHTRREPRNEVGDCLPQAQPGRHLSQRAADRELLQQDAALWPESLLESSQATPCVSARCSKSVPERSLRVETPST